MFHTIVSHIMNNNPGRHVSNSQVKSFHNKSQVNEWNFNNLMQFSGAINFVKELSD